jgi:hypothetical protein
MCNVIPYSHHAIFLPLSIFNSCVNLVHSVFLYLTQKHHLKQFRLSHLGTLAGSYPPIYGIYLSSVKKIVACQVKSWQNRNTQINKICKIIQNDRNNYYLNYRNKLLTFVRLEHFHTPLESSAKNCSKIGLPNRQTDLQMNPGLPFLQHQVEEMYGTYLLTKENNTAPQYIFLQWD